MAVSVSLDSSEKGERNDMIAIPSLSAVSLFVVHALSFIPINGGLVGGRWPDGALRGSSSGWRIASVLASHLNRMYVWVIKYSMSIDQPGKVANPARGQLNRENDYFHVPVRA